MGADSRQEGKDFSLKQEYYFSAASASAEKVRFRQGWSFHLESSMKVRELRGVWNWMPLAMGQYTSDLNMGEELLT